MSGSRPRRSDRELRAGSIAHYEDPAYYTSTYAKRLDDVAYYVDLAKRAGGPVLEYGVGNGRIALPVARHGIEVVGVDHSREMLADLRTRLANEPAEVSGRVRAVRGDMRRVRLRRRFPLVLAAFNTALHLYTRPEVEAFLSRVSEHLAPGGKFVVDLSVPPLEELMRRPSHPYHAPRFAHPSAGVVVKNREYFDYDRVRQILFVSSEFEAVHDKALAWTVPLAHRQFFPQEWSALAHYNGFRVERVHGDFYGGPLTNESEVMVWHLRRRRAK